VRGWSGVAGCPPLCYLEPAPILSSFLGTDIPGPEFLRSAVGCCRAQHSPKATSFGLPPIPPSTPPPPFPTPPPSAGPATCCASTRCCRLRPPRACTPAAAACLPLPRTAPRWRPATACPCCPRCCGSCGRRWNRCAALGVGWPRPSSLPWPSSAAQHSTCRTLPRSRRPSRLITDRTQLCELHPPAFPPTTPPPPPHTHNPCTGAGPAHAQAGGDSAAGGGCRSGCAGGGGGGAAR
jgi:hypothetical protein